MAENFLKLMTGTKQQIQGQRIPNRTNTRISTPSIISIAAKLTKTKRKS